MTLKLQAGVFYGSAKGRLTAPGFRYTESAYEPGLNLPSHSHELAHFCLVLKGSYTEQLGSKSEERRPSALIFYPPDTVHAETSHTGGRHLLIEIEPWRISHLSDFAAFRSGPIVLRGQTQRWVTARLLQEFRHRDELSLLALESLTLELMIDVARDQARLPNRQPPRWLNQAKQVLEANCSLPPSLDELAAIVGVHPAHLTRVFHRFQQCTISEYVRQLRVALARRKLIAGRESLVEIALASGFSDHSHFSRSFKRVTGMTPTQFRRRHSR